MLAFVVFTVGYTLSQFYRSALAVIAPELSKDLALAPSDLGAISACWFAAFALAQFTVGIALDRYGPRRTLPVLMLAGVAGALAFAHARDASDAMFAMSLIGVGCSGGLMGPMFVFARDQPPERFAYLSALTIGFGTLGNLLGGTPLAIAAETLGWRGVFSGLAVVTLVSALLIAVLIKDPPDIENNYGEGDGLLVGLKDILSMRNLWPVWPLMAVGYGVLITERGLWVGPYLSEVHALPPVQRGNIIFLMAAAISLGAFAYGPLERWLRQRKAPATAGSATAGATLLGLFLVPEPALVPAAFLLCLFGFTAITYGTVMAHVRHCLPDRLLGRGMTFANFLCMGGACLLQLWTGHYADHLKHEGLSAPSVYAALHLALALVLLSATAIYALSREPEINGDDTSTDMGRNAR